MASATVKNLAVYSLAIVRFRAWYKYKTALWFCPRETTYRLTRMGLDSPGIATSTIPDCSCTKPAPGKQFLGECGALPVRCVSKYATKRLAACPVALFR